MIALMLEGKSRPFYFKGVEIMQINGNQKIVLVVFSLILILIMLFPPWDYYTKHVFRNSTESDFAGFHFYFDPPYSPTGSQIKSGFLAREIIVTCIIGRVMVLLVGGTNKQA